VFGSVEFVGTKENKEIIYRDGWKEQGRIPTDYVYSGYCILSVKPSDSSAIMVEFNQLNNKNIKQKEDTQVMDEKQMEQIITSVKSAIAETNSKNDEFTTKIAELNEAITAKDTELEGLNAQVVEAISKVEAKDAELAELNATIEKMKQELNQCKKDYAINELNQALVTFSEEEKEFAKDEIAKFNEDYASVEVNQIVKSINAGIGAKAKELQIAEINAAKTQPKMDDIFDYIEDTNKADLVDLGDLFE
jgi:chromosome segregation ATPase